MDLSMNGKGLPVKGADETSQHEKKLGGKRAVLFVYAMMGLETMAFFANGVSLVTYFVVYMNFGLTKSSTTLTNFMGTAHLLPLLAGFVSDTYITRFKTSVVFGCIELVGYIILAIQAHFDSLRPRPCMAGGACEPAVGRQAAMLYSGLYLFALGNGGVKAALPSLGADQFDSPIAVSSFFNWFFFSFTVGASLGVTFVVWISTNEGWDWGFGLCAVLVAASMVFLLMGRSRYRNNVPGAAGGSPLTRILQVLVATTRNWRRPVPEMSDELHERHDKEASNDYELIRRTEQFKFLDRAAITTNSGRRPYASAPGPWRMCTVTQVEETKILLRMSPIILSTAFMNICLAQLFTLTIQQGLTMDTHLAGGFHIPVPSLTVIPLLIATTLVPIYDRAFVPLARRITGIPSGITHLQRVGVGLVLSSISMAVAGAVEWRRKSVAVSHGMVDAPPGAPLPMSVFWLSFQYVIFGTGDVFTIAGMLDFFYTESSAGMKSLSTSISWCSLAIGYYGSSVTVEVVNRVTGGWLASNNLNRDRLDYFYWLLAGLGVVNFVVYLVCASSYKYKKADVKIYEKDKEVDY